MWLVCAMVLLVGPVLMLAQTPATNEAPAIGTDPAIFPSGREAYWKWAIAIVTPLIVWGVSKIPNVPRPVLPTLAPILGFGLGFALQKLTEANFTWVDTTQAGLAATGIREIFNQWVTKQMKPLEASKTDAVPIDRAVAVSASTPAAKSQLHKVDKDSPA